jgi:hypothetical protein
VKNNVNALLYPRMTHAVVPDGYDTLIDLKVIINWSAGTFRSLAEINKYKLYI